MKILRTLLGLVTVGLASVVTLVYSCPEPQVVSNFEPTRYANNQTWFEVARTRNEVFEFDLACVGARYVPDPVKPGRVGVFNSGRLGGPTGKKMDIVGYAYAPDPNVPAKLNVKFPTNPVEAPYWVVYVDEDYQRAIIYSCSLGIKFGWILSREPLIDKKSLKQLINRASQFYLKPSAFQPTLQTGCW